MSYEETLDRMPVSSKPPYGASVVVYRTSGEAIEYLLLHRAHNGPDFEGDWVWTSPAGARLPNEDIRECATRELLEETGLRLCLMETGIGNDEWVV